MIMSVMTVRKGKRFPLLVFMISSQSGRFYITASPTSREVLKSLRKYTTPRNRRGIFRDTRLTRYGALQRR